MKVNEQMKNSLPLSCLLINCFVINDVAVFAFLPFFFFSCVVGLVFLPSTRPMKNFFFYDENDDYNDEVEKLRKKNFVASHLRIIL